MDIRTKLETAVIVALMTIAGVVFGVNFQSDQEYDLNEDGIIDVEDISILLENAQ